MMTHHDPELRGLRGQAAEYVTLFRRVAAERFTEIQPYVEAKKALQDKTPGSVVC